MVDQSSADPSLVVGDHKWSDFDTSYSKEYITHVGTLNMTVAEAVHFYGTANSLLLFDTTTHHLFYSSDFVRVPEPASDEAGIVFDLPFPKPTPLTVDFQSFNYFPPPPAATILDTAISRVLSMPARPDGICYGNDIRDGCGNHPGELEAGEQSRGGAEAPLRSKTRPNHRIEDMWEEAHASME